MRKIIIFAIACSYISFLLLDITNANVLLSTWLKFSSVILCFSLTLFSKRDALLIAALALTIAADWFLLIQNIHLAGVLIFCIVQIIYNVRHGSSLVSTGIYLFLCAASAILIGVFFNLGAINTTAILYAALILRAAFFGFKTKNFNVIAGMCLFLLCDLSVALHNASQAGFVLPPTLSAVAAFSMWLFYLPSQFLLAQSRINFTK